MCRRRKRRIALFFNDFISKETMVEVRVTTQPSRLNSITWRSVLQNGWDFFIRECLSLQVESCDMSVLTSDHIYLTIHFFE